MIGYLSGATADMTLDVTNLPAVDGQIQNVSFIVSQGATPYIVSTLQIGGTGATIKWSGGAAPTGTANAVDVFSFTIIRRNSTWEVLGAASKNFA